MLARLTQAFLKCNDFFITNLYTFVLLIERTIISISMNKDKTGFTIVELIVAIMVLGIVIASLSSLFLGIQRTQTQASYKESATRAAQRQIESLRNNNYNSLAVGTDIPFTEELSPKLPSGSTGNVVVTEPSAGLKRVDVTVTYPDKDKQHKVVLSSLIGVIGITQ